MPIELADESSFQLRVLRAPSGLNIKVLPNGCIYEIECNGIQINQVLASPVAGGIHRIYLRLLGGDEILFTEIVGPRANSSFASSSDRFVWSGSWQGLQYRCTCQLHTDGLGWFFHVEVENRTEKPVRCDAILLQDIGLASRGQVRNNEIFTSQYLDHLAVPHPEFGHILMTRQNLKQTIDEQESNPWLLQGCSPRAKGFSTDGLDFFGVRCKDDSVPAALMRMIIGDRVRQGEAGYTALQGIDATIDASRSHSWTFFSVFVPDHPQASSSSDLDRIRDTATQVGVPRELDSERHCRSIFETSDLFSADDLSQDDVARLFPGPRRHEEFQEDRLLSFFVGEDSRHVVLKAKELLVARPHGHILRSGRGWMPDAELMSCTFYAAGVFASQLAHGHTSLGKLLSVVRDPFNRVRSSGLRMFVRTDATSNWQLLGVPSAFEMALDHCRWIYKRGDELLTVTCISSNDDPALTFDVHVEGRPVQLLICGEIVAGAAEYDHSPSMEVDRENARITIRPSSETLLAEKKPETVFRIVTADNEAVDAMGGDELLFTDGKTRGLPYFAIRTRPTASLTFRCDTGVPPVPGAPNTGETPVPQPPVARTRVPRALVSRSQIQDALTWYARDALVHLSTPRGLEQANGGAWGVRDVCQGPVEFLLSYDHGEVVADILRKLFSQQYHERLDWPQWFAFPPFEESRSSDCHGDVLIWPLKALCDYLEHTNDGAILQERHPYTHDETFQPTDRRETILEHVDRLLQRMRAQFLPGLSLPRYGEGDWDDSLQPADPLLRERMVSSWTTELMYQTLRRYSVALAHFGEEERVASVCSLAAEIEKDFQRYMVPDQVVAGFAAFAGEPHGPVEYLLHPSDTRTGLRYRLIPMTRGILSGIFSPEQANHHLELIREHLLFPDGARLMDRPTTYRGGVESTFRRSESAAFFGREIGLQYVHAHLRYAEALAVMGRADELWRALLVVNPIAVTEVVPNARRRQRNCYFSSSDAAFRDRYDASQNYEKLRRGEVPVDGGWRIYSSGPGIYTSLVIRHLFGLRRYFDCVEFDPVLPRELDGTMIELDQCGRRVRYQFSVRESVCSPKRITVNGVPLAMVTEAGNPYRAGAARVKKAEFEASLALPANVVHIDL